MTQLLRTPGGAAFAETVAAELPYLRRYARALTGSQRAGDACAAATLEALIADRSLFDDPSPRVALFRAFHVVRARRQGGPDDPGAPVGALERKARARLAALTPNSREALLLGALEGFAPAEIARIMQISQAEARRLAETAVAEMSEAIRGRILIIEDEPIIAMDLRALVGEMGHETTAVARTREEAVALGRAAAPDLILADIRLADGSSGIDAANDLLAVLGARPVIFITAFPERLLTGARPEPAFLIAKPYTEDQVRSAVSQAMFFAGTEPLAER